MKQGILRAVAAILFTIFLSTLVLAQTAAYTMHTIAAGESLSSLAKAYHTTVGDIMRLNGMHTDSKLSTGEKIKIPATSAPVSPAKTTPAKAAAAAPATNKAALTHTVQSGESLYRISQTYKVPVQKLITLNHLPNTGEIKVGQVLKVSDGTAPAKIKTTPAAATTMQPAAKEAVVQQPAPQPKGAPANTAPAVANTPAPLQPAPVQQQSDTPATTTVNSNTPPAAQTTFNSSAAAPKEGFFTAQFRQNVEGRSEEAKTGAAMTFKSASGWADKKFYILMNDAPPGSIVKITNGNNAVYAKVLWSLGAQKENDGLDFRISTAAAAALNITDEKFDVTVTYFQ